MLDTINNTLPKKYREHNNLDFYVNRNVAVMEALLEEEWVDKSMLVVSGHSQGSSVALGMCDRSSKPTHLIYSTGMPYYSTILSLVSRRRMAENQKKDKRIETYFDIWKEVVDEPLNNTATHRDPNHMLSSFSIQENDLR